MGQGTPERAAPIYLEHHNLESIAIYAARDGRPRCLCGLPLGRLRSGEGGDRNAQHAIGARALYSPLSPPHLLRLVRLFGHGGY